MSRNRTPAQAESRIHGNTTVDCSSDLAVAFGEIVPTSRKSASPGHLTINLGSANYVPRGQKCFNSFLYTLNFVKIVSSQVSLTHTKESVASGISDTLLTSTLLDTVAT